MRATEPPDGLIELQISRDEAYETGKASALARLPTRKTDREIPGEIGKHIDEKGRRAFSQPAATGYWLEKGSSGSPIFIVAGQQLAGIVSMAELGDDPQNAPIREAYVVPGTILWPFVKLVAEGEFGAQERAIQQALLKEAESSRRANLSSRSHVVRAATPPQPLTKPWQTRGQPSRKVARRSRLARAEAILGNWSTICSRRSRSGLKPAISPAARKRQIERSPSGGGSRPNGAKRRSLRESAF